MISTPEQLKSLLLDFCDADVKRYFNFSSGHLGVIPMSDANIRTFLECGRLPSNPLLIIFYFVVETIFPVRWISILTRAILRCKHSPRFLCESKFTVLSLGKTAPHEDPYFGPLLENLDPKDYNYLKVVGGYATTVKKGHFIEMWLNCAELIIAILLTPFLRLALLGYSLKAMNKLDNRKKKKLFVLLAIKEINSGNTLNQSIIVRAVHRHICQSKIQTLLYPLEGRNWEKRIVCLANKLGIRTIGYLHCALTPRHLSLLDNKYTSSNEWPTTVIAPGQFPFQLLSITHPTIQIRKGYFLRGRVKTTDSPMTMKSEYLLFVLTGDINESKIIMQCLANFSLKSAISVMVRLNPNNSNYNILTSLAKQYALQIQEPLDLSLPSICFYRSSSVALSYLRKNVPIVYIVIPEIISSNIFELSNLHFDKIEIGPAFDIGVINIVNKYSMAPIIDGDKIANAYLDEEFSSEQLISLLN